MRGYEQYTYYLQLSAERTGRGGRGGPARPQRLEVRREAPTSYRVFAHHRMSQVGRPPLLLSQQQAVSRPSALAHYDFVRGRCVPCALLVLSRASLVAARGALWSYLPRRLASFSIFMRFPSYHWTHVRVGVCPAPYDVGHVPPNLLYDFAPLLHGCTHLRPLFLHTF